MGFSWVFSLVLHEVRAAALLLLGLCVLMIFAGRFVHKNAALTVGGLATAAALYLVIEEARSCGVLLRCAPPPANADPSWWISNLRGFEAYLYVTYIGPLFVASCAVLTWAFWRWADAESVGQVSNDSKPRAFSESGVDGRNKSGHDEENVGKLGAKSQDPEVKAETPSWWAAGSHQEGLVFAHIVRAFRNAGTWLETTEGGRTVAAIVTVNVVFPLYYYLERAGSDAFELPQILWALVFTAWLCLINGLNFWFMFKAPRFRSLFGIAILLNVWAYLSAGAVSLMGVLYGKLLFYAMVYGPGLF